MPRTHAPRKEGTRGAGSLTAGRIADAARRLFNAKGYGATSLSEIAAQVGISQGNLTYHFPAKRDLVRRIQSDATSRTAARRAGLRQGPIADDYVEHLLFAMNLTWNHRFVFRDRAQFAAESDERSADVELRADFEELHALLQRIEAEGMFRRDASRDLFVFARSLWIVSRYWMDYLGEMERLEEITWSDQERGIQQHYALLLPSLTADARREFLAALHRAPRPAA